MPHSSRPYILHEANYRQMLDYKPNVAVLPWGATEGHNYHLPYGTDNIEADALGEAGVERAHEQGARCVLLPTIPYGIDHTQLNQVATITMRARTQQAVLYDVAESLVKQGIDRLVVLNFHGGNDFKSMIRDVVYELPIFIVQIQGFMLGAEARQCLKDPGGDHANEFETALVMHLAPDWVAPLDTAHDGSTTPSHMPKLSAHKAAWFTRDWAALTESSGVGDPRGATAESGKIILDAMADELAELLVELSAANRGDFPLIIRD